MLLHSWTVAELIYAHAKSIAPKLIAACHAARDTTRSLFHRWWSWGPVQHLRGLAGATVVYALELHLLIEFCFVLAFFWLPAQELRSWVNRYNGMGMHAYVATIAVIAVTVQIQRSWPVWEARAFSESDSESEWELLDT